MLDRRAYIVRLIVFVGYAVLSACATNEAPDNADPAPITPVFILAGQSNMTGQSKISDAPPEYASMPNNVIFYNNTQVLNRKGFRAWATSDAPRTDDDFISNRGEGFYGPELGFAHAVSDTYLDRDVIIIKFSLGGTGIDEWSPAWEAGNFPERSRNAAIGSLFQKSLDAVKSADISGAYEYKALVWVQGENDALSAENANSYGDKLTELIDGYRSALDAPDLQAIVGEINPVSQKHKFVREVQAQMAKAAAMDDKVTIVSMKDLSMRDDGIHADAAGSLELGQRLGEAWLASQMSTSN